MNAVDALGGQVERPLVEEARACRARGGHPVAVLCGLIPPELIAAAGGQPVRLRTTGHAATDLGSSYFAPTHCSLVRRLFDQAVRAQFSEFDAVLFATGCDHSRRVFDAWRHADAAPSLRHLVAVSSDSSPAAVLALERELEKLAAVLRAAWGVAVSDEALRESIARFNRQRRLLEELALERRRDDCPLSGRDLLALHLRLATAPVDEGTALVEAVLREARSERRERPSGELRLFLASGHFEELARMEVIERHAGRVVRDLMCTGTGFFHGLVDESKPPMRALAERALRRLSCPHAADELERRIAFVAEGVRDWRCDGVILDRLAFCTINAAEAFVVRRRLREQGIAVLELEGELGGAGEGQLRTRLEAFAEQLRNRKAS